jgi:hypothetical protein
MFIYVMVTHWEKHWDNINETHYPIKMIKFEHEKNLIEKVPTLFIKLNRKTKEAEKAWIGYVYNIRKEHSAIRFNVFVKREIPPSKILRRYLGLKEGWYLEYLFPPFFASLESENWEEFENGVFWLLKLIGLHNLYRFERQEQRGRSDGFFVFKDLVVIYDCTLEKDFEKSKAQQIGNYVSQLKNDRISWRNNTYTISNHMKKQVWIITRGAPRVIERIDGITVKEVPVQELIEIYVERLIEDVDEEELVRKLLHIAEQ